MRIHREQLIDEGVDVFRRVDGHQRQFQIAGGADNADDFGAGEAGMPLEGGLALGGIGFQRRGTEEGQAAVAVFIKMFCGESADFAIVRLNDVAPSAFGLAEKPDRGNLSQAIEQRGIAGMQQLAEQSALDEQAVDAISGERRRQMIGARNIDEEKIRASSLSAESTP